MYIVKCVCLLSFRILWTTSDDKICEPINPTEIYVETCPQIDGWLYIIFSLGFTAYMRSWGQDHLVITWNDSLLL